MSKLSNRPQVSCPTWMLVLPFFLGGGGGETVLAVRPQKVHSMSYCATFQGIEPKGI